MPRLSKTHGVLTGDDVSKLFAIAKQNMFTALLILKRDNHYLQSMPCLNAFYLLLKSSISK